MQPREGGKPREIDIPGPPRFKPDGEVPKRTGRAAAVETNEEEENRGGGLKGRKADVGLIETKCLKLCPKRRVVAIDASRPETWHLIEPGTPIDRVAERLGLKDAI